MFEFDVRDACKAELYHDLHAAMDALTAGEPDPVANMANAAALIWEYLPDIACFPRIGMSRSHNRFG